MKLLVMQPYGERRGHFGLYTAKIAQELARMDHEVTVVADQFEPAAFLNETPRFTVENVAPAGRYGGPHAALVIRNNMRVLPALIRRYREDPADAVHLFDYEPISTYVLLAYARRVFGVRIPNLFLVIHPADFEFVKHRNLKGVYKLVSAAAMRRLVLEYSSGVTVHGHWHRREIHRQLRLAGTKARMWVVPYGTDPAGAEVPREAARRMLNLPSRTTVFLFFGMIRKDKGFLDLLTAVGGLDGEYLLLVVGAPFDWSEHDLARRIADSPARDRIVARLGYVPDGEMARYFSAADAVVLPYVREYVGGSGPLALACSYGRPVIASRVAEMTDLVSTHGVGLLVEPSDAGSLREGLRRFLTLGEQERAGVAASARRLAAAHSWANMAEKFSRIYAGTYPQE